MSKPARISYWVLLFTVVLVGWLHLATPLLAVLFSYFVLSRLQIGRSRWVAVLLFLVVLLLLAYGLAHLINQAIIAWAEQHGVELPFTDYESLKALLLDTVSDQVHYLGNFANFARGATTQFVFLIIGCVVAMAIYLNSQLDLASHAVKNNLYSLCCEEIALRFRALYESFATVMGAQIIISTINPALTSIFVLLVGLPHAVVAIGCTFLAGLLPVVGNLISNTMIVAISFTLSPKM